MRRGLRPRPKPGWRNVRTSPGRRSVSSSLYGFVKGREPVSPEEVVQEFLSLPHLNGGAHGHVEGLFTDDPRLLWEEGALCTTDVASLPLDEAPYVVFDLETTGSSAKEGAITEIGALKVVRGRVVDELATLVNPGRRIEPFVVRLTGITDRMVADAPSAAEVMPLFEEFVEGCVLAGHNVQFDCSFVTAAREKSGHLPLPNLGFCSLQVGLHARAGIRLFSLRLTFLVFWGARSPNSPALRRRRRDRR